MIEDIPVKLLCSEMEKTQKAKVVVAFKQLMLNEKSKTQEALSVSNVIADWIEGVLKWSFYALLVCMSNFSGYSSSLQKS